MTLKVIGAGFGRTGTNSLKLALEHLLGEPCYHMFEAEQRPGDFDTWRLAAEGRPPNWATFLEGFGATVDGPSCHFWAELAGVYPEAIILLSTRDVDDWYRSAEQTIIEGTRSAPEGPFTHMESAISRMTGMDLQGGTEAELKAVFQQHNQSVIDQAPADRLVIWQVGDGWAPLCEALNLPIPELPFPHVNSTEQFRQERIQSN